MNSLENIEKLKTLLDSGAINEEEYEEMKKQALASFGKEEEKPKETKPKTGNFFADNYETIHIVGVCILIFTTLFSFIANMIGLYSNIKFQLITNFIVGFISLLYVPCGIIYGVYQKNWKSWLIVITLFLILICSLVVDICWFAVFSNYYLQNIGQSLP